MDHFGEGNSAFPILRFDGNILLGYRENMALLESNSIAVVGE